MKQYLKKMMVCMLVLAMMTGMMASASAATISFSDVPSGYWGYNTIMRMTKDGLFKGTSEPVNGVGTFMPEKTMTRAEFVTAVVRVVCREEAATVQNYSGQWWMGYYHLALRVGLLNVGELDNATLDLPMSRQEMAMVLVRALKVNKEPPEQLVAESQIADFAYISSAYKTYVRECFSMGLIVGIDEQGTFAPTKSLTRAEAATVLCRLLYEDERVEVEFLDEKGEEKDNSKKPARPSGGSGSGSNTSGSTDTKPEIPRDPEATEEKSFDVWDYTWNEYMSMNDDDKRLFENEDDFFAWLESVQRDSEVEDEGELPWEEGGKTPDEYSLDEYLRLSEERQLAFREYFGSDDAFYAWMESQIGEDEPDINEDNQFGGMSLDDFTMDDYFDMDPVDQALFKEQFFDGDDEALMEWIDSQVEMPDLSE